MTKQTPAPAQCRAKRCGQTGRPGLSQDRSQVRRSREPQGVAAPAWQLSLRAACMSSLGLSSQYGRRSRACKFGGSRSRRIHSLARTHAPGVGIRSRGRRGPHLIASPGRLTLAWPGWAVLLPLPCSSMWQQLKRREQDRPAGRTDGHVML